MRGGAWGRRSFRLFFYGQGISAVGDRIVLVALAFAVLDLTGSVKDLSIVLAAQAVPLVAFVLIGGVWSDRLSRRSVMIGSDLVRAGAQGASALLLVSGNAQIWQLAVLQAVYGAAEAFFVPAAQALLPETVATADLQKANALVAISRNVANIGGPAAAGVLVATVGPGWGLAIDGGTFLASAAALGLMRLEVSAPAPRTSTISELRAGWRAFRQRSWLWVSVLEFMAANALDSPFQVLGPQVARTSLGGAGAWAAINTASGIGAVLGGTSGLRWQPRFPLRAMFLTSLVGTPALLVLLAAAAPLAALIAAAVISGMSITFFNLVWFTVVQERIPGEEALAGQLLGRARLVCDQSDRPCRSRSGRGCPWHPRDALHRCGSRPGGHRRHASCARGPEPHQRAGRPGSRRVPGGSRRLSWQSRRSSRTGAP